MKERGKVFTGVVNFAVGVWMLKLSQYMLYEAEECVEEDSKFVKAIFKTNGIVGSIEMLVLKLELCWVLRDGENHWIRFFSNGGCKYVGLWCW